MLLTMVRERDSERGERVTERPWKGGGKLTNKDDFGKLNINVGWSTKYLHTNVGDSSHVEFRWRQLTTDHLGGTTLTSATNSSVFTGLVAPLGGASECGAT